MIAQEKIKDDEINLQDALTDLPISDEQAEETKGGSPYLFLHCATGKHI
jgi:hypothetical protein